MLPSTRIKIVILQIYKSHVSLVLSVMVIDFLFMLCIWRTTTTENKWKKQKKKKQQHLPEQGQDRRGSKLGNIFRRNQPHGSVQSTEFVINSIQLIRKWLENCSEINPDRIEPELNWKFWKTRNDFISLKHLNWIHWFHLNKLHQKSIYNFHSETLILKIL